MNVLFVSQCSKRALTETRRILDQFAERRGERTWQTPITQAGLDAVRRLLRKTARKNTAVACHWIRGLDHTELLWIVGDAGQFNANGATPTNTTQRNILRSEDENDWHTGEDIRLLAAMAALLHDLGKASVAFQERLEKRLAHRNTYRHEWVSLRLFQSFVGTDDDAGWLHRLAAPHPTEDADWINRLQCDGLDSQTDKPLAVLPPLAQAIGWLILSHHRLPVMPERIDGRWKPLGSHLSDLPSRVLETLPELIDSTWNEFPGDADPSSIKPYWTFPQGLPTHTSGWHNRAARIAERLLQRLPHMPEDGWLGDPYVANVTRLVLMLADHQYSSLTDPALRLQRTAEFPLYANTDHQTGKKCQPLDEHLLGVEKHVGRAMHAIPALMRNLPPLRNNRSLRKRSEDSRFSWQDKAADLANALTGPSTQNGFFGINLASTGCGKTLGNARIMNAIAGPEKGLRCTIALGLRTLTLQTGKALRERLSVGESDLAIRVGGSANRELFEHFANQAADAGAESRATLLPDNAASQEDQSIHFEGPVGFTELDDLLCDRTANAMLAAPLLVCTVDHLMPATESLRGGHQIVPMLRLMSGDLVLDELDDFDIEDLPALTRLVFWAGMLGSRVLLSSATLPPSIVQGMFGAYQTGRKAFLRNRGEKPDSPSTITCAWFDEFSASSFNCSEMAGFESAHLDFVRRRQALLEQKSAPQRLARIVDLTIQARNHAAIRRDFASTLLEQAGQLHQHHHSIDPRSLKRISFGLIRMANITPLIDVALALYALGAPEGMRIHLCVYHSQFPLLLRSNIEAQLDAALNRHQPSAVFELPDIRGRIDAHPEADQLFIVLGSPITEVGRDHDYDWAIVEPSSMRSMIQLAGRVCRHRDTPCTTPNIVLLDTNLKHLEQPAAAAFCKPGFEKTEYPRCLKEHRLRALLSEAESTVLDSRPRILPRLQQDWQPQTNLVDLEHFSLSQQMLPVQKTQLSARDIRIGRKASVAVNASSVWTMQMAHIAGALVQRFPFRFDPTEDVDLVLMPDEDGTDYTLMRIRQGKELVGNYRPGDDIYTSVPETRIDDRLLQGKGILPWNSTDYLQALATLAQSTQLPLAQCAKRYGTLKLPKSDHGWLFHPALGLTKNK